MVNGTTPSGHRFELVQLISGQILTVETVRKADVQFFPVVAPDLDIEGQIDFHGLMHCC